MMTEKQSTHKITAAELQRRIEWHIKYSLSKRVCEADKDHLFTALAMAVRDLCIDSMFETAARHEAKDPKRIYYLSLEYLLGRLLPNNLYNFEIMELRIEDGYWHIDQITQHIQTSSQTCWSFRIIFYTNHFLFCPFYIDFHILYGILLTIFYGRHAYRFFEYN